MIKQADTIKHSTVESQQIKSLRKVFTALEMSGDDDQTDLDQDTPLPCHPHAGVGLLPAGFCSSSTERQRAWWWRTAGLQGLQPCTPGQELQAKSQHKT